MIQSILSTLSSVAQLIAQWPQRRKEAARRAWSGWRNSYELKAENRRRRAYFVESVDRLRDKSGKLQ